MRPVSLFITVTSVQRQCSRPRSWERSKYSRMEAKRPRAGSRLAAEKCQQEAKPVMASLVSQRPSALGFCCITLTRP